MKYRYISHRIQLIKSFYSGIGKTAVIYPAAFLVSTGIGTVSLGIIFYMRDKFNATPSQIGYLSALWSLLYVTGCLFIRPIFNRVLPRFLLIISTFLMTVSVLWILLLKHLIPVYVMYGMWGLSMSLFWPSLLGWLSQGYEGKKLSRVMSFYNLSWSIGIIVSPFLAGFLSVMGKPLPLFAGSAMFFTTTVMLLGASLTLPMIRNDRWVEVVNKEEMKVVDKSTPLRFPAWIGIFSTYTVIGTILNVFPVYARETLGYNEKMVGILLQQRAIFATLGFLLLGRTTFWHFKWPQLVIGHFLTGIVVWLLRYAEGAFMIGVIMAFIGFLMSQSYFNSAFHGVSGSPKRSTRMAINEAALSLGLITGSSVGGLLYERYSMETTYMFCSFLVLFIVFIQIIMIIYFYKRGLLSK